MKSSLNNWVLPLYCLLFYIINFSGCEQSTSKTPRLLQAESNILSDTIEPHISRGYIDAYKSYIKALVYQSSDTTVINPDVHHFIMPTKYINFFSNMIIFKTDTTRKIGSSPIIHTARHIWAMLALAPAPNDTSKREIKLYFVFQNNQDGVQYYDVTTDTINATPTLIDSDIASKQIVAFAGYNQVLVLKGPGNLCQQTVNGFHIGYDDLYQLANYPLDGNIIKAELALKPCSQSPREKIVALLIKCKIKNSTSMVTADSKEEDTYFDFTLPCPTYCPE